MRTFNAKSNVVIILMLLALTGQACSSQPPATVTPNTASPKATETSPTVPAPVATILPVVSPSAVAPSPSPRPAGTSPNTTSDPLLAQVRPFFEEAAAFRQLPIRGEIKEEVLSPSQVRDHLEQEMRRELDPGNMERDQALYQLLGQISESDDLFQITLDLISEQVAGFYLPNSKQLFVVANRKAIGPPEKVTLVHEYVHGLQDQYFDLKGLTERAKKTGNSDQSTALQALYEGDATLAMTQYMMQKMTMAEIQEIAKASAAADSIKLATAPWMMRVGLMFPYKTGMGFVGSLKNEGGWTRIDMAYGNPPVSTEQIMHPQKYRDGEKPQEVKLPDLATALAGGWREVGRDVLGEIGVYAYLSQFAGVDLASKAAEGWGGDRFVVLKKDGQYALAWLSTWDSVVDAEEFFAAYGSYIEASGRGKIAEDQADRKQWLGTKEATMAIKRESDVLVIVAKDQDTTQAIAQQFRDF